MNEKQYMGSRCKRGHSGLRYKSSKNCVECQFAHSAKWHRENSEKKRASQRKPEYRKKERERRHKPEYMERQREYRRAYEGCEKGRKKKRERRIESRKRQRLLRLLPDRLWLVEQSWPKQVAIARMALGGSTEAERDTANEKLALILKKEKKEWLSPLIMSCAMRTTRPVTRFPLSLESSREG